MIKRRRKWISSTIAGLIMVVSPVIAQASQGSAIVKVGRHCPSGYGVSGEYCVPKTESNATTAIEKKGSCPSGFSKSGDYCVASKGQQEVRQIVEKKGACPSGYKISGEYCVAR